MWSTSCHQVQLLSRFHALRDVLQAQQSLWRPAPFHEVRPAWCQQHTELTLFLLGLSDAEVATLAADNAQLLAALTPFLPALQPLPDLLVLLSASSVDTRLQPLSGRAFAHIPGRKQAQIQGFSEAIGEVHHPVLEWCAGKGHLGRWLARRLTQPVTSLEWDAGLAAAGEKLARRSGVAQRFICDDALSATATQHLPGHHAVALHACGDLHLALLRGAVTQTIPALDVAPCCYYRTAQATYTPLNADAGLTLTRDELHLAVTETVTSGGREQRLAATAQAWKLAFLAVRAGAGIGQERTFPSVPASWLSLGFSDWMRRVCEREGVALPAGLDWAACEQVGWQRQAEVRRLELVRLAFRRALELWLVFDRAVYLARNGYTVNVAEFCPRETSPRNVLISARRG